MSGEIEVNKCQICDTIGPIQRTYFNYDIKCECHSPNHFEVIFHCYNCVPKEPVETKIIVKTKNLSKL